MAASRQIPLWLNDVVRAHVTVDATDFDWLGSWQWKFQPGRSGRRSLGYAYRWERGRINMHDVVMDAPEGMTVDHIDGDGLNNRRANLRLVTPAGNRQNLGVYSNNTSGYRGVGLHARSGKWRARVCLDGRLQHLGLYETPEEAARVASEYRRAHMPFAIENVS